MSTLVDILHSWSFEHYPIEILEQISFTVVLNDNGVPTEIIADTIPNIRFNPASPTFFADVEKLLFRMWGLKACKRPFRTFVEKSNDD